MLGQFWLIRKSQALDRYHAEKSAPVMGLLETPASVGRQPDGA